MARNPYHGDKRRREIAKKKKREEKLARKRDKDGPEDGSEPEVDNSYLEYLHPGGLPEELLPDEEEEGEEDSEE